MKRIVVRFKRNKLQLIDTLDKMITLLEESDIHVLSATVTKYTQNAEPGISLVADEATLILKTDSDWGDEKLEAFKLGNFFN